VGSVNLAAACGLSAGLEWLQAQGLGAVRARVLARTAQLLAGLAKLPGVRIHGSHDADARAAAVSITVDGLDSGELAERLAARGVIARGGFQCAPLAHRALGTERGGTLRQSAGPDPRDGEIADALAVLNEVL
jgi:selenocysteine lyase/cysteine desulfurase